MLFEKSLIKETMQHVVGDDHVYQTPTKLVKIENEMQIWDKSDAYHEYLGFIVAINETIRGKSNSVGCKQLSVAIQSLICGLLDPLERLIDETPPINMGSAQRFGNAAFRTWHQKVKSQILQLLENVLTEKRVRAIPEVMVYLLESFGNTTRLDYGTGHEVSFLMFLCCLFKIGFLQTEDKLATGCCVFPKYLQLVRKLQQTYRLEPAGSHGAWSLDDHQFVPFIWGSAQLCGHDLIAPSHFPKPEVFEADENTKEYMFLACIKYINQVKTGPFHEHSFQLWSISGTPSWAKINSGLICMYKDQVLGKLQVVQHIMFGSLLTLNPAGTDGPSSAPKLQFPFNRPSDIASSLSNPSGDY